MLARTIAPTSFGDDPNISLVTFPASAIASSSYVVPETYNCAHVTRRPGPSPGRALSTHSKRVAKRRLRRLGRREREGVFTPLVVDGDDDALDVAFARGGRARRRGDAGSSSPSSSREKTRADEKRRATSDGKGVVVEDERSSREREREGRDDASGVDALCRLEISDTTAVSSRQSTTPRSRARARAGDERASDRSIARDGRRGRGGGEEADARDRSWDVWE